MRSASFVPHMNHVSVSPTNGNGLTQGQRKTLIRVGIMSLCGPISISRANAHMVHMGYKTSTSHYTLIS